jgi:hypothetical protein
MVSNICVSPGSGGSAGFEGQCAASYGPTVDAVIRFAAQRGIALRLRTVAPAA